MCSKARDIERGERARRESEREIWGIKDIRRKERKRERERETETETQRDREPETERQRQRDGSKRGRCA